MHSDANAKPIPTTGNRNDANQQIVDAIHEAAIHEVESEGSKSEESELAGKSDESESKESESESSESESGPKADDYDVLNEDWGDWEHSEKSLEVGSGNIKNGKPDDYVYESKYDKTGEDYEIAADEDAGHDTEDDAEENDKGEAEDSYEDDYSDEDYSGGDDYNDGEEEETEKFEDYYYLDY